jgi:hypothetical protein
MNAYFYEFLSGRIVRSSSVYIVVYRRAQPKSVPNLELERARTNASSYESKIIEIVELVEVFFFFSRICNPNEHPKKNCFLFVFVL